MSSASHLHVMVTVGVLPPREEREVLELCGVHLAHESGAAAAAGIGVDFVATGVATFFAALLAAEAAVGLITDDAGLGALAEAAAAVATLGVGLRTGATDALGVIALGAAAGVPSSGSTFSSVGGRGPFLTELKAAATSARDNPLVGVLVKLAGRGGRTAAGCSSVHVFAC